MTSLSTPSSTITRTDSPRAAGYIAAAGYAAEGIVVIAQRLGWDGRVSDHLLDAAYAVAVLATVAALPALVRLVDSAWARTAALGRVLAQVGLAAMGVESAVSAVHRVHALGPLFGLGILLTLLGLLILAVAGLARGGLRWPAPLPLLGMVVAAAGGGAGASLVTGAIWLLLARRARP